MMKQFHFLLFILIAVILLTSCDPVRRYEGPRKDLIATTIYSIPGIESHWTDMIEVLEQDDYGRVLYAVCMTDNLLVKDSLENCALAVLIMQKSENGSAYFYAENNYVLSVVSDFVDLNEINIEDFFPKEEILALKEKNDWNCSYQNENAAMLCVPISVDKTKRLPDISDKIIDNKIGTNYRYAFFREDKTGKNIYFITNITESSYECYLIVFSEEGTLIDEQKSILKIDQYKAEGLPLTVQEFLYCNAWEA